MESVTKKLGYNDRSLPEDRSEQLVGFKSSLYLSDAGQEHATLVWKGFRHFWQRTIMRFALPHRIQSISNYILDEIQKLRDGKVVGRVSLGQHNVIDGNYMFPKARYSGITHPEIHIQHGRIALNWSDSITDHKYPQARSTIRRRFIIPYEDLNFNIRRYDECVVLLQGFHIDTSIPAGSSQGEKNCGFWPYRMYFSVANIRRWSDHLSLDIATDIYRAWTPKKGGIPRIFEVDIHKTLQFEVTLYFTLIAGNSDKLRTTRTSHHMKAQARLKQPRPKHVQLERTESNSRYHLTGFQSFGFEFSPHTSKPRYNHLGRYIGGIEYSISDKSQQNTIDNSHQFTLNTQVWVPKTVHNTNVAYFSDTITLHLDKEKLVVTEEKNVEAHLCMNSDRETGPFPTLNGFTRKKCCSSGTRQIISTE